MTTRLHDLLSGFHSLNLNSEPIIVHASLKSFGKIEGGAETVVSALLAAFETVIMPAFTYKTMIIPPNGPLDNAIVYGSGADANRMAEFFTPAMPADPLMGAVAETFRKHPHTRRSSHPILSFAGVSTDALLRTQTLADPFAPFAALAKWNGWVLMLGVDHTVNTSIHHAEKLAGRRQFVRWALTPEGVRACPGFPGCSAGFQSLAADLDRVTRQVMMGDALVQAVPLSELFKAVKACIKKDPLALLCQQVDCPRCTAIRHM